MKGFVYILKNELGRYYVGSTSNLERRLHQHKSGTTHSTKRMGSMLARQIEFKLKRLKRKDFIEKIIKEGYIKIKL